MIKSDTPAAITVTLEIDIELYAFASFAADLEDLPGPGPLIARKLADALDQHLSEPVGHDVASSARPGLSLEGSMRSRRCLDIDVPLARPHARMVASGYANQKYFSARDMIQGVAESALMEAMTDYEDRVLPVATDWRPEWLRKRLDLSLYDGDDWPF